MKTAKQFRDSVVANKIKKWIVRECGKCGYECGFIFFKLGHEVIYDHGCECTPRPMLTEQSWEDVAAQYNSRLRTIIETEYAEFWRFEPSRIILPFGVH